MLQTLILFSLLATETNSPQKPSKPYRWNESTELYDQVKQFVLRKDFAALTKLGDEILEQKLRFKSGDWALAVFYDGIGYAHATTQEIPTTLFAWQKAIPKAHYPGVALARVYRARAWELRGNGTLNSISPNILVEVSKLLETSRQSSIAALAIQPKDPELYNNYIEVLHMMGRPQKEIDEVFQKAMAVEPGYYRIYTTKYAFSGPNWGGSVEQLKNVIAQAEKATKQSDGISMYARLAHSATYSNSNIFRDGSFSWVQTRESAKDLLARWPDSKSLPYMVWYLAALAQDKSVLKELKPRIGGAAWDDYKKYFFRDRNWFEQVTTWAEAPDPAPVGN